MVTGTAMPISISNAAAMATTPVTASHGSTWVRRRSTASTGQLPDVVDPDEAVVVDTVDAVDLGPLLERCDRQWSLPGTVLDHLATLHVHAHVGQRSR